MRDSSAPVSSETAAPAGLRVRCIGLQVPDRWLWRTLSFEVRPGLTWIRGGDGVGKTSLLRVLAGASNPTEGEVDRRALSGLYWADPTDPQLDGIVAREWLARCRDRHAGWDSAREAGLCDAAGIGSHLDKTFRMLSTGTRRKLTLVGALACGEPLVLVDQPFAGLDRASRSWLADALDRIGQQRQQAMVVADTQGPEAQSLRAPVTLIDLGD